MRYARPALKTKEVFLMNTKPVYTLKMARYLIDRGFEPVETRPNPKDLHKDVWLFQRTHELEAACDEYIESRRQGKTPEIPKFSNFIITKMHTEQGLPIETISQITKKSTDKINEIIQHEIKKMMDFGLAALNDTELKQYINAQSEDERNRIILERMKRGGFVAYGGHSVYEFPKFDEEKGVNENA